MQLGNLQLPSTAALAPMAGVGDTAFRLTCKRFGAAYVVGEMASSKGMHFSNRKTAELLGMTRPLWPRPPAGRWNLPRM